MPLDPTQEVIFPPELMVSSTTPIPSPDGQLLMKTTHLENKYKIEILHRTDPICSLNLN